MKINHRIFTFCILLVFSYVTKANATIDIIATIQSIIQSKMNGFITELSKNTIELGDGPAKMIQSFTAAKGCFPNPTKCNLSDISNTFSSTNSGKKVGDRFVTSATGNVQNTSDIELEAATKNDIVYVPGSNNSVSVSDEHNEKVNKEKAHVLTSLFAQSFVTRYNITNQSDKIYQSEFSEQQIDEVLRAQAVVLLTSEKRWSNILRLRSSMNKPISIGELAQIGTPDKK